MNPTLKDPRRDPAAMRALGERAVILKRLRDYELMPTDQLQTILTAKWKAAYPEAAAEQSAAFHPLVRREEWKPASDEDADEIWMNDVYSVTVRRGRPDKLCGTKQGVTLLGISSHDGTARHDFRDMQAIKNQIAGEECEAIELFPAESRLLDPSNYYMLWCYPGVKRLHVGIDRGREVKRADEAALASQRAFAGERD